MSDQGAGAALAARGDTWERLRTRFDAVSDRQLFAFTVAWVIAGGLFLQLFLLPHVLPHAHWGHGIIADQDSAIYHGIAVDQAEQIRRDGWSAWQLRPGDHVISGIASVLYLLVYPEPWAMLPLNGILFAIAVTAVRRLVATLFRSDGVALAATAPFFIFPSFVPIWGQLQKDVLTGAGLALVLTAAIRAGYGNDRRSHLATLVLAAAGGMFLVWLARPYGTTLVGGGIVVAAMIAMISRQCDRLRLVTVTGVVIVTTAAGIQPWRTRELPPEPPPVQAETAAPAAGAAANPAIGPPSRQTAATPPGEPEPTQSAPSAAGSSNAAGRAGAPAPRPSSAATPNAAAPDVAEGFWWSRVAIPDITLRLPRTRRIDPSTPLYGACAPYPSEHLLDKALFSLCTVREGFIGDAKRRYAGSAIDYEIRLRTFEDFVAYVPRALGIAFLEPYPVRWSGEKESPIGRLGSVFVPFEMAVAYLSFAAVVVFAFRRLRRLELWAILSFCAFYNLTFAYTMPQLGTVYRMRAFAFAIVVSTALGLALSRRSSRKAADVTAPSPAGKELKTALS